MHPPRPVVHHIPVCPFSQRLEILLALKGADGGGERGAGGAGGAGAVEFRVVDITRPRDPALLRKTGGSTALPVLELPDGRILKESLVILRYLDAALGGPPVAQRDPWRHALEHGLERLEGGFVAAGYRLLMAQEAEPRRAAREALLAQYAALDAFLREHAPHGPFLFERFGWAETVFAPFFRRFELLAYYEDFALPQDGRCDRVAAWREACLAHPAAQQVTTEEVVKLYYDYALGVGNGALAPGRRHSSFAFEPGWRGRPWPPRGKPRPPATDAELGLG